MKDFVKTTLAVICGFFIIVLLISVFGLGSIGALLIGGSSTPTMPRSGVLTIDLSEVTIGEQAYSNPLAALQSNSVTTVGLWDAVQALNTAADDPAVKFIYLRPEGAQLGMAHMEELRTALAHCRAQGKPVIAYMTNITTGAYYLASVADRIYSTAYEGGTNMFVGVSSQLIFLGDLLNKLGVNVQLIRHGKYKSAGEMYTRSSASADNLEQNQQMISSMWHSLAAPMAEARGISEAKLNSLIDELKLNSTQDFVDAGLVDALYTREELKDRLATLAMVSRYDEVQYIKFSDYVAAHCVTPTKSKHNIAVIYADGEIVEGSSSTSGQQSIVSGARFASEIARVRADSTIKAVVFRVNSPGGSVLASEQIRTEIQLLQQDKPVVASYGEYAASGGYWISAGCTKVYADATTLTGSIGVYSMIPEFSKTARDLAHVNITSVGSNKHSDMLSAMRPFDAAETAYMQSSVEDIYSRFVSVVSEGRDLEPDYVDSIAQGRVWTGTDGLRLGLVDEIGTLEDAIHYAALLASGDDEDSSLDDWTVIGYPAPPTGVEMLLSMLTGLKDDTSYLAGTPFAPLGQAVTLWLKDWNHGHQQTLFARIPYEIEIQM